MAKILLVEDDSNLGHLLKMQLEQGRHLVDHVASGFTALSQLKLNSYELVILDWMLPDLPGVDVCRQFRGQGGRTPILMLTARGSIEDKASGLNAGADDYLVKPFHPVELNARVQALLRRPQAYAGKLLTVRDIELDTETARVFRAGQELDLTAKEFALLELLMRYPNQSFTLETILNRVWQSDSNASVDTVRTHMKTLRRKLGDTDESGIIRTKRGAGYRIVE
ncbi:MAG TPA: response regulator transcription factor [Candidatus Obscuribacter sp.]|jgi:two-component system OmpR family response regulator|nr:response regulator transcription factor [Candidatus Melainabacteria bacterium]MBK8222971.1 response regulator transcription factor [Candidatus Obscuribacter sp.]MBK9278418.1 response regulator transcription factor [Candidatus Obscuribacter sp.]MBL8082789.1 response regulator transcription factor [Candidatus Obscuribacter sp.]MDX1987430.1 response regulator transcription factor [Candidatus Obscuribacter sp.]